MAIRSRAQAGPDLREALDEVGRRLGVRGMRYTPQRRAVAEAVLGAHQPVTAAQVHDRARRVRPEIGLMTVYRALDTLADVGVVRRVHGQQRCEAFVAAGHKHGHTVVCTLCGRAEEFTHCHIEPVANAAAAETGFSIDDHFLQFSGVCRDCRLKRRGDASPDHRSHPAPKQTSSGRRAGTP